MVERVEERVEEKVEVDVDDIEKNHIDIDIDIKHLLLRMFA